MLSLESRGRQLQCSNAPVLQLLDATLHQKTELPLWHVRMFGKGLVIHHSFDSSVGAGMHPQVKNDWRTKVADPCLRMKKK